MRLLRQRPRERGQAVVEFALILPIILFLVLGMTEMGFAISHDTSLVTATREGARVGAALRNGHNQCPLPDDATSQGVDLQIIAATEGVIASPGSPVSLAQVQKIELIELDENGATTGNFNVWLSSVTGGVPTGPVIPSTSQHLYFAPQGGGVGGNWPAYKRCGAAPAHSIQVKITYVYKFITPLGSLINALHGTLFGSSQITMTDQTSMALEPPTP
jgi:Flp pilus assembly protein TadG